MKLLYKIFLVLVFISCKTDNNYGSLQIESNVDTTLARIGDVINFNVNEDSEKTILEGIKNREDIPQFYAFYASILDEKKEFNKAVKMLEDLKSKGYSKKLCMTQKQFDRLTNEIRLNEFKDRIKFISKKAK